MAPTAPTFTLFRGTETIAFGDLDTPPSGEPTVVDETARVGFSVEPREDGHEYEIRVGDVRISPPHLGRKLAEWTENVHFDSARGETTVTLFSRTDDTAALVERASIRVLVTPTKIGESIFRGMSRDLAALWSNLVVDLLSKSSVGEQVGKQSPSVSSRSAQIELGRIAAFWPRFAFHLEEIVANPYVNLKQEVRTMNFSGYEQLRFADLARLATSGVDPRRRETPRPFMVQGTVSVQTMDTHEHQVLRWFLYQLIERTTECGNRARREIQDIRSERGIRGRIRASADGASLFETVDLPKIDRLTAVIGKTVQLSRRMRSAANRLGAKRLTSAPPDMGLSPIFRNVPHYHQAWGLMRAYLFNPDVLLDSGSGDRLKQTWRLYEQWLFLQLASAFRSCGLRCVSQKELFAALSRYSYTVDLQRGARLEFVGSNLRLVMRYEPWIFPKDEALRLGETVYKGNKGNNPWSPDVLIEIFRFNASSGWELENAVVVDAKYMRRIGDPALADCLKYLQIRCARTDEQLTRQVWLAYPGDGGIVLDDDAIGWTARGPTAKKGEHIRGTVSIKPTAQSDQETFQSRPAEPAPSAVEFARGLIAYLES